MDPRVGVGAFILHGDRFVTGVRKGSHGAGCLQLPGGHLEFGESWEECARREILEETGLAVRDVRFLTATNDVFVAEVKHYITIFMVCNTVDKDPLPRVLEPEKCERWEWRSWEELRMLSVDPSVELFLPLRNLLKQQPDLNFGSSA
ncbi:NUDIX hydrolase domain-like protein [Leucosporidium creatinivorum]|uniref:NUDIX hydrolase domain-like protein n=1 Tax=Leucosporidium creatinivorum TaxID=106004 RepID=A0A1Y2DJS2_9BASI|nr:NUDIX hydrolase domain-like protein [Leucosporidium creatinivorum]